MRLDQYLVENGFVDSRNKAQTLIKEGSVRVNSKIVKKASLKIDGEEVSIDAEKVYVSRAAMKLKGFLPELPFEAKGMNALDIGASTGGFTEVLLEFGVAHVDAVDVGSEQLHGDLKKHDRVTSIENMDIRKFSCAVKNEEASLGCKKEYELVVSDVSFISLLNILDDVDRLASKWIILLFKPQFEVGREAKRDRNGVIKDDKAIAKAMMTFEDACQLKRWEQIAKSEAIVKGKEGNIEYCYCYKKY